MSDTIFASTCFRSHEMPRAYKCLHHSLAIALPTLAQAYFLEPVIARLAPWDATHTAK